MGPPEIHLRATLDSDDTGTSSTRHPPPRIKPPPQSSAISAPFSYSPSDDGTDENLLILLHGLGSFTHRLFVFFAVDNELKQTSFSCNNNVHTVTATIKLTTTGDTHVPFSKLSRSFKLPQTATLALRAPEQYVKP